MVLWSPILIILESKFMEPSKSNSKSAKAHRRQRLRHIRRRAEALIIQDSLVPISEDLPFKFFNPYGEIVWKSREIYKSISRLVKKKFEGRVITRNETFLVPQNELPKYLLFGESTWISEVHYFVTGVRNLVWQKGWKRIHLAEGRVDLVAQTKSKFRVLQLKRRQSIEVVNNGERYRPRIQAAKYACGNYGGKRTLNREASKRNLSMSSDKRRTFR